MSRRKPPADPYLKGISCGILLAIFGAMVTGGAALTFGEEGKPLGDAVMTLLFGVVPLVLGIVWASRSAAARRKAAWEETERKVLTLAMARGGILSALEVAAKTDLSLDEAKRYLDRLADQGHVDLTPSDQGLVYRFPGAGTPLPSELDPHPQAHPAAAPRQREQ